MYEQAEAAARDRVNTSPSLLGEGSLQVASASDLLVQVLILNGRATSDESLAVADGSLRVKEAQLGGDHPDVAESLFNLGDVLAARAQFERAILVTERGAGVAAKACSSREPWDGGGTRPLGLCSVVCPSSTTVL